ncbi:MAG: heterodisulfide reductase-related iron-sulfur binding cluster [Gammaproteobacteria bacterium]|nr:MAG: heterodisulfide reductase-related iron-sulfur binding cluster [Gammaproteobacteria bacterium]
MCGLCLSHCPTYQLAKNENESPRGRISLGKALLSGQLALDNKLNAHIDHCLQCLACEDMCPSRVNYGSFMDGLKAYLREMQPEQDSPFIQRLKQTLVTNDRLGREVSLLRLYQKSGLQWLLRHSRLIKLSKLSAMEALLPSLPAQNRWQASYPADIAYPAETRGTVALFTGCITNITDNHVLASSIKVLNRLGYQVDVPGAQLCCGAIHHHEGDPETAATLAEKNIIAFSDARYSAIITVASGCAAQLLGYPGLVSAKSESFAGKVTDVCSFLAECDWGDIELKPLDKTIAVHEPCSLRNVLHAQDSVYQLLQRIPAANILPLPDNATCCGGAGMHMLKYPEITSTLRQKKIAGIGSIRADIITTSNTGCSINLGVGLRESSINAELIHPVCLIHRQMTREAPD